MAVCPLPSIEPAKTKAPKPSDLAREAMRAREKEEKRIMYAASLCKDIAYSPQSDPTKHIGVAPLRLKTLDDVHALYQVYLESMSEEDRHALCNNVMERTLIETQ